MLFVLELSLSCFYHKIIGFKENCYYNQMFKYEGIDVFIKNSWLQFNLLPYIHPPL